LARLPDRLTLLVGTYLQARYLPQARQMSVTELVRASRTFGELLLPLPHPSWRCTGWMARSKWFEHDLLPELHRTVRRYLIEI
jgi:uracil-DNA glycosylase